ncbi:MAG: C1 family peptidase [Treponema sp.]|nr:C1 family peptidase [Treponema sp.]
MPSNRKFTCFLSIFLLLSTFAFGQGRGAIFDEQYDNLPRRAELSRGSYEGLPAAYSLKQFAPLPGDQADYGTCVAWAAAYGARTISESIALNRLNQTETTKNAFSPVYIYRNIKPDDHECVEGTQIYSALDYMRDTGTVKMLDVERTVSFPRVNLAYYRTVRNYPIADYVTLFSSDHKKKSTMITRIVKKSISEGKPVIIGMNTPDSFSVATEVWRPTENPGRFYYGHALCVIGYDDSKYGGAFELLNSWGRKWGNGGYIWIPYQTFVDFVLEGYEIIENIASLTGTLKFDGFVRLEVKAHNVPETRTASLSLNKDGNYTTTETFSEGTQARFIIGSKESAYVYSFMVSKPQGSGNFYSPVLLFPSAGVSPLLNYSDSAVIVPAENKTITLDSSGAAYVITLYSKHALNITHVMHNFTSASGTINKRLASALGDGYTTSLVHSVNEAAFTLTAENSREVAALVVEIGTAE